MDEWRKETIGRITTKIGSGITPRGGNSVYFDSGIPLVRSQNVLDNQFSYAGLAYIGEEIASIMSNVKLNENDVLLNITGDSVARCTQVPPDIVGGRVNQHVAIIRANKNMVDPYYLKLHFVNNRVKELMLSLADCGGTRKALTKSIIENIEIDLPPLIVQRRIAAILSSLDDKIENNRKTCEKLEEIAQAIFKRWFVEFEFPNEKGLPYKSSGGEMVYCEELGKEIPKGWRVGIIEDVAQTIITGKTPPATIENRFGDYMQFVTIPDLHQGSFIDRTERYTSKEGAESQKRSIIPKNSIMVSCIATPGLIGIASEDCITNQQINSIVCKKSISFIYIYYLIKSIASSIIDYASSGSATPNLNKTQFSKMGVLLAPQELIINFHRNVYSFLEKVLSLKREIAILQQVRDALLPKLMSGELAVEEDVVG